jgi:hypothetical protein
VFLHRALDAAAPPSRRRHSVSASHPARSSAPSLAASTSRRVCRPVPLLLCRSLGRSRRPHCSRSTPSPSFVAVDPASATSSLAIRAPPRRPPLRVTTGAPEHVPTQLRLEPPRAHRPAGVVAILAAPVRPHPSPSPSPSQPAASTS